MKVQFPRYAGKLLQKKRYKVLFGGRGSSKSYTIARLLLLLGRQQKIRVLCAREFQNSITESVHFLLKQQIEILGLTGFYTTTNNAIYAPNGTEFIFKGIHHNVESIKSMASITHVWIEEAHTISKSSWDVLIPTIREPGSEIWVSFNPSNENDPTYEMFVNKDGSPKEREDAVILKVNHSDNPWFPDVLQKEMDYLYTVNPELADHVWGGACRSHSDAQIFKGKYVVRPFEALPCFSGPYFGADFGFSNDPSTLVKIYINKVARELLIRNAWFGYGVEIDKLGGFYEKIPGAKSHLIRADCARPETISFLNRQRFNIKGCKKWTGCVEDGIEWMKSFKTIVIHPECEQQMKVGSAIISMGMITEARNYSYKVDRLSGDVLSDIVDAFNHGWDAARYACEPMIMSGNASILDSC